MIEYKMESHKMLSSNIQRQKKRGIEEKNVINIKLLKQFYRRRGEIEQRTNIINIKLLKHVQY